MEWGFIHSQMEGVAKVGRVELRETKLATYFVDTNRATRRHFFRNGLPAYVTFSLDCISQGCIARYGDNLTMDGVVNWMATQVLRLPRILYYLPQTLVSDLIQNSGPHKVKLVIFSTIGGRVAPFFLGKLQRISGIMQPLGWCFGVKRMLLCGIECLEYSQLLHSCSLNILVLNLLYFMEHSIAPCLKIFCKKTRIMFFHNYGASQPSLELSQVRAILRDVKDNLTKEAFLRDNGISFGHFSLVAALALKAKWMAIA